MDLDISSIYEIDFTNFNIRFNAIETSSKMYQAYLDHSKFINQIIKQRIFEFHQF